MQCWFPVSNTLEPALVGPRSFVLRSSLFQKRSYHQLSSSDYRDYYLQTLYHHFNQETSQASIDIVPISKPSADYTIKIDASNDSNLRKTLDSIQENNKNAVEVGTKGSTKKGMANLKLTPDPEAFSSSWLDHVFCVNKAGTSGSSMGLLCPGLGADDYLSLLPLPM